LLIIYLLKKLNYLLISIDYEMSMNYFCVTDEFVAFFCIVCKDVFYWCCIVMKFVKYEFNNVKIEICKMKFLYQQDRHYGFFFS